MNLRGKKLLFLGGAHFQVPAITAARRLGMIAICADNRPENPGHTLAHESFPNCSTIDTDAVLALARELRVDGVLNYGSDVSAVTCATVCQELGLPGHSPGAVDVLTDKDKFRQMLRAEQLQSLATQHRLGPDEPVRDLGIDASQLPLIIKPIDSSGSKGVKRVTHIADLERAVEVARKRSRAGVVVIETFVQKRGFQVCGDGWFEDGKVRFVGCGNGHFHDAHGGLVPYAETFPSLHPQPLLDRAIAVIETMLVRADFGTGAFNLDLIIDENGEPFVIEIGPRNGGNFIPQVIAAWTGVDLTEASVRAAVDPNYRLPSTGREVGFFASYMLHRMQPATFEKLQLHDLLAPNVMRQLVYAQRGDPIAPFTDGGCVFGNLLLRFDDQASMMTTIDQMQQLFEQQ